MVPTRSSIRSAVTVIGMIITSAVSGHGKTATPSQLRPSASPPPAVLTHTVLDKYCVSCHNQKLRTADLALDTIDVGNVSRGAEVWERVIRKLRAGAMPPPGRPRPDQPTTDALVSWLEKEIDRAAVVSPNSGRTEPFHRLNRAEYANAIRDLLALEIDLAPHLPADDADNARGFDNNAKSLSMSPALLERYMLTARKLSRLAVGLPPRSAVVDMYRVSPLMVQDAYTSADLPFGSRGGLAIYHHFPVDGEYSIKVTLQRNYVDYIKGLGEQHQLDVRLDGVRIIRFQVGGENKGRSAPATYAGNWVGDADWEDYALRADAGLEVRFHAKAGRRLVGVSFVGKLTEPEGVPQPRPTTFVLHDQTDETGNPGVETVAIAGPYTIDGSGETPSRSKIFMCRPVPGANEESCAERILTTLARRAYRRPITQEDIQTLLGFYRAGRSDGGFDAGIQLALERILSGPDFLFRMEYEPAGVAPGSVYRISDLELASRLSFFLWSSIPDDELLDLAVRQKLKDSVVLEQQVRRLLADPRSSRALVDNFVSQWLHLRELRGVRPDPRLFFPEFDENLREAFQQETELFVESQLGEDRSVVDLLTANYSFVNERLARHYRIPNIYGTHFRRVTFGEKAPRGGLLGQGSILSLTSYPNRTSPVLRGKWLLENIFGTPPPEPPPNVPGLPERGEGGRPASVRERLEQHRKNPVCATCHAPMDPLGFALENFDSIGRWRSTSEAGTPIDASAVLPGGAQFSGVMGLRTLLSNRQEQFVTTVAEKLLAYALGRGLEYYDMPTLRAIVREAAPGNYRWSSLILGIVKSAPFQMRRAHSEDLEVVRGIALR